MGIEWEVKCEYNKIWNAIKTYVSFTVFYKKVVAQQSGLATMTQNRNFQGQEIHLHALNIFII